MPGAEVVFCVNTRKRRVPLIRFSPRVISMREAVSFQPKFGTEQLKSPSFIILTDWGQSWSQITRLILSTSNRHCRLGRVWMLSLLARRPLIKDLPLMIEAKLLVWIMPSTGIIQVGRDGLLPLIP